jgi:hypothetical protein
MNFLLVIRVAEPAVSIQIESVMAAFRAMIARQLRGGNDELVQDLAGSAGDAVRLGEEEPDGAGGVGAFVARPVSQPLELGGTETS